jgi:hypothetical protein
MQFPILIHIEQFLDEHNIIYARKVGDTGIKDSKEYVHKISMEKFGQILFSIQGSPEKASNQKKQIFDKYYSQIFNETNFDIGKSAEYVNKYFEIKEIYESNKKGFDSTDQKIFYILYINAKVEKGISKIIDFFEKSIKTYTPENEDVSQAKQLIQLKFKEHLDKKIESFK